MEFSAQQIAEFLKGEVVGNKDIKVSDFSKIEEGRRGTPSKIGRASCRERV